jgi:hypothetical protein
MTVRAAAAELIEVGRVLGRLERSELLAQQLRDALSRSTIAPEPLAALRAAIEALAQQHEQRRAVEQRGAKAAQARADELLVAVEHPGARLAYRLLAAARAARRAWQTHR